jgi:hypothetical protein
MYSAPSETYWHEPGLTDSTLVLNPRLKTMKNLKRNAAILGVALALAATSVSQAVPVIRISDGSTTITVTDNLAGDGSAAAGFVQYTAPAGTFAGWSVVLSAGTTKPVIGSATKPELDLVWSITRDQSAVGPGTLTVMFSENDFNLAANAGSITASGGTLGAAGNQARVRTYYAANNVTLNAASLITDQTFNGPNAFANNAPGAVPADPAVSFTVRLDLTQAPGTITSGDIHLFVNVPEGGSMVTFLGTALLALGAFAARRKA